MADSLEKLKQELQRWDGVGYEVIRTHRHPRIYLSWNNSRRFINYSSTKVDPRGLMNKVSELRRMLRDMGAERRA